MEAKPHPLRSLEITVISGQNINVSRSSLSENVYVVVRAESLNCCKTKMVNQDSGLHAWNEKFMLDIPKHAKSVTFEVQCEKYKGVRPIGVARIALSDFLSANNNNNNNNNVSEGVPQMLCYGLRNWEGQRNGVIHFSVRVVTPPQKDHLSSETKEEKDKTRVSCRGFENEVMGFQVNPRNISSHVVTGIPVSWSYQSVTI